MRFAFIFGLWQSLESPGCSLLSPLELMITRIALPCWLIREGLSRGRSAKLGVGRVPKWRGDSLGKPPFCLAERVECAALRILSRCGMATGEAEPWLQYT